MHPALSVDEIMAFYGFDFTLFVKGWAGLFFVLAGIFMLLTIVLPLVIRKRDMAALVSSLLATYGLFLVAVIAFVFGYMYQEHERGVFSEALVKSVLSHENIVITSPEGDGYVDILLGGRSFHVPRGAAVSIQGGLMDPRNIPFVLPVAPKRVAPRAL